VGGGLEGLLVCNAAGGVVAGVDVVEVGTIEPASLPGGFNTPSYKPVDAKRLIEPTLPNFTIGASGRFFQKLNIFTASCNGGFTPTSTWSRQTVNK
jgi:hypothetical protein